MKDDCISITNLAKELNLYVRITASVKAFENYNSFYNIYSQYDDYCRRIVVLTPYEELEEVDDEEPDSPIKSDKIIDGNVWIKEYPLITNPNKIDLDSIMINNELAEKITSLFKEKNLK